MAEAWHHDRVLTLRHDLILRKTGDGRSPAVIEDPTFGRRYTLDAAGARVVRAIDGRRTIDEVVRRANLGARGRITDKLAHEVFAFLRDASLLADGAATSPAPPSVPMGTTTLSAEQIDALEVEVLPGARFSCQGTGMCCGGYSYGPITDAEAARIEAHAFTQGPDIPRDARFEHAVGPDGKRIRVLATRDGACVFLDTDRRCRIHAELGPEAKPSFCQTFPFLFTATPQGRVRVSLNMECGGMAGARFGEPVQAQAPRLLALARSVQIEQLDARVHLDDDRVVSWEAYRTLEDAWMHVLEDDGSSVATWLARMAYLTMRSDPAGADATPVLAERLIPGPTVARPVLEPLLAWASASASDAMDEGSILRAELHMRVRLAAALLLRRPDVVGDLWPQAAEHLDALPGTVPGDVSAAMLRLHLRNAVFGGWPLRTSSVSVGLGWMAVKVALMGALGPIIAAHARRPAPDTAVMAEAVRTVNRVLRPSVLKTCFPEQEAPLASWGRGLLGP